MVVLLNPYGQRSNVLFQHVHLDSFCRENNIYFYNEYIQKMKSDYANIPDHNKWLSVARKIKIPQLLNKLNITKYIDFNNEQKNGEYKSELINNAVVFCDGWLFRSHDTVQKYRSIYQHIFKPRVDEKYLKEKYLLKDDASDVIIGLHIRRGDYKDFEGGKYMYSDEVYRDMLLQLTTQLDVACKIIIFSNDKDLNQSLYKSLWKEKLLFSDNNAVADHYLMSKCDYLIGPPSTFSMWASYIGEVPMYHVQSKNDLIDVNKFSVLYEKI